jgi:hypothetical protein
VVLRRFARTGEVATHQGRRLADPANTIFTHDEDMRLLELVTVLDDKSMLQEIRARYCLASGMEPAMATVCRAMRRLGFTRKKLHRLARQCDEHRANVFYCDVMENHSADQLFFLDETSKDNRALNRSYGYALRGHAPRSSSGIFSRGQRRSYLCGMDMHGIVDFYSLTGTFKAPDFFEALELMALPHMTPYPGPRSVLVLDNASIHKKDELEARVRARGGRVLFLPPYCWFLNPIEEAFGKVRQVSP